MHPAIALAVFPVIFLGELPVKTMFASLVLAFTDGRSRCGRGPQERSWFTSSSRSRSASVCSTCCPVGRWRWSSQLCSWSVPCWRLAEAGRVEVTAEPEVDVTSSRIITTAFVVIFLAEWGDLTQILTANLAAHYHSALSVAIGSVLALWAVAAVAVLGGQGLLKVLEVSTLRLITGFVLSGLAIYTAILAIR